MVEPGGPAAQQGAMSTSQRAYVAFALKQMTQ
jgi:hypothetical protein